MLAACQKSVDLVNGAGLVRKMPIPVPYLSHVPHVLDTLHLAVEQNNPALVDELLHYGASPLASTSAGDTCYHLAARQRDARCLGLVLRHGQDRSCVDMANDQGMDLSNIVSCHDDKCSRPECSPSCSYVWTTCHGEDVAGTWG